jgi:hypothetical protein
MRHFHYSRNKYHCPIVNLDKIWSLVGEEVRRRLAAAAKGGPLALAPGRSPSVLLLQGNSCTAGVTGDGRPRTAHRQRLECRAIGRALSQRLLPCLAAAWGAGQA